MTPPGESWGEKYFATVSQPSFESKSPEQRINTVLSLRAPQDVRFLSQFMEHDVSLDSVTRLTPTTARAVFRFRVHRFYCNASGNLHGGAQALIFDMMTSIAMQSIGKPGWWLNTGVSRSLNCTYLRPAPEGTDLLCEVEVVNAGKSLALLRGVIKREKDGAVISTSEHDKSAVAKKGWDQPKL